MRQLQAQGKTAVSLMRGEPDFKSPAPIAEAALRALQEGTLLVSVGSGGDILARGLERLRQGLSQL